MMALWNKSLVLWCVVLLASFAMRAIADGPPPRPDGELKVLDQLVGEWTSENTITVLDAKPQELKATGSLVRKWVLKDRYLEETNKSSSGEEAKVIFGVNPWSKEYTMSYFSSDGVNVNGVGTWNQATQTLNWRSDLGNGMIQTGTIHFTRADQHEWESKVVDAQGKVLFSGGGVVKRRK